jgi:hypothetical protein
MVWFTKSDCPIWLLLGTGHCLGFDFYFFSWGLVLLLCNLLWTFLRVMLRFVIGRSLALRPCLILIVPWSINRRHNFEHTLLVLLTRGCCCIRGNWMVRFDILNYPIFLSWSLPVLLVADTPVTTISCVVASVAKTLCKS